MKINLIKQFVPVLICMQINIKYFFDDYLITYNFRTDNGTTNLNHIDEFVFLVKHMKNRESTIQLPPVRKNPKKKKKNWTEVLTY